MGRRPDPLQLKIQELRKRYARQVSTGLVPAKKKSKPVGYKLQNTFEKNLAGVPGGARNHTASAIKMIAAKETGTRVRSEEIGLLRSARNANTTQGSYIRTVLS